MVPPHFAAQTDCTQPQRVVFARNGMSHPTELTTQLLVLLTQKALA
jgi:hypothetical protein